MPYARGSAHSFTVLADADGVSGPSPDNPFLVGSPWYDNCYEDFPMIRCHSTMLDMHRHP